MKISLIHVRFGTFFPLFINKGTIMPVQKNRFVSNSFVIRSRSFIPARLVAVLMLLSFLSTGAIAQIVDQPNERTRQQLAALFQEKAARTPAQQKINTQLIFAARQRRSGFINRAVPRLQAAVNLEKDGRVKVDIDAVVTDELLAVLRAAGAEILESFPADHAIRALVSVESIESLAGRNDIRFIRPAVGAVTNAGSVNSEGDVAHRSNLARLYGATGFGIKVGVLSDSIDNGQGALAAAKAKGDVPTNLTVLPGQAGSGEGEGLAMLEIVHDLAPSSPLYFATGFNGPAGFAQNIRNLATAGCKVIIDDVTNFSESPFQDGPIAQAVNDVSARGVLFFSSARNSGNKNDGTSSTWEGDFVDGGDASAFDGAGARYHAYTPGQVANTVTAVDQARADLFWSDPLGGSSNDYDLFIVDSFGNVLRSSLDTQNGTQDPYESVDTLNVGERIGIVKFSGAGRFLHLDTGRCRLSISTAGCVRGHNASGAPNAFSVAETNANNRTTPFTGGAANPVNTQSSDGPRRVFFNQNGAPYTPGNFSSTGGIVLQKPDITAATGVKTTLPTNSGLNPFFGTSAAAPHAGAIAAQILSFRPGLTPAQVRIALYNSCLDIEAAGFDRDSGRGIVMALGGINFAGAKGDFNYNGGSDVIFQHTTGARSVWLLNGAKYAGSISLGNVSPSWNIVGLGDFNRDGKADILWQNTAGARSIWLMNGATRLGIVNLGTISTAWNLVGAGDFNGDGIPDILLQNTSGAAGVWIMNGIHFARSVALPATPPSVHIAGSGDFNGDGKTDLVLQDTTSGARAIWLMNGTTFVRSVNLGLVPTSWRIGGTGDFNRDGKPDILFENTSGARIVWIMNGTAHFGTYNLPSLPPTWTIRNR